MKINALLTSGMLLTLGLGARAEILYTIQENSDTLCTIDTSTGLLTPIGWLGVGYDFGDLAYDAATGTMYMVDGWGGGFAQPCTLYTVDLNTGAATAVGPLGVANVFGLAIDPTTGKLYGSTSTIAPTAIYEISKATGVATFLGDPLAGLDGLTYVGSTGQLVGLFAGPGSLHTISTVNGTSTPLSPGGGFVNNCGIAWGAPSNTIFSIDWSGELYAFDVANAYARTTLFSGLGACDGLASTIGGCTAPVTYCTAGTTTNNCVPSISGTGTPSASAGSGFTIAIANVEGQKSGLIFYGVSGATALPWGLGSSFLCVKPPTQRTPPQSSNGTAGACNGTLSIDWNAYIAANPGALGQPFAPGDMVWSQGWFRDPPSPKTTNLSNGLQFTVCP